jgi:hypothetical protein
MEKQKEIPTIETPMEKPQWLNVLMIENAKGAVIGIYAMEFEKGKTYRVDKDLGQIFIEMGIAAISMTPQNLNVLHVNDGKAAWGAEIV